jgi:hypothetical protein
MLTVAAVVAMCGARSDAAEPFNGTNLDGWKTKLNKGSHHWTVGSATLSAADARLFSVSPQGHELINAHAHGQDIYSTELFGDAVIELEVMVPQGSNSGIYVQGEYEVQVFDSYGKEKPGNGDMGAIYNASPPHDPAYRRPGEWNTYRIEFQSPRFDQSGKKVANAKFIKVELNGKVIHENVEMQGPTLGGLTGQEKTRGPIMFQGDHGAVAYRNIRITPGK